MTQVPRGTGAAREGPQIPLGAKPGMAGARGGDGGAARTEGGALSTGAAVTPPGHTPRSASNGRPLCVQLTAGTFYLGEGQGAAVWMVN